MLKHLLIRNVALVDELNLSFEKGLNVLTGETGAGKSIIVDSVNFLIGGRADKEMIRTGCSKAYVEGVFDISQNQNALSFLSENELEVQNLSIVISREMNLLGRSVCRVDGITVSLTILKDLASLLIDIHGQHEHQSLLDERKHLGFLDEFGDENHTVLLNLVRKSAKYYIDLKKQFDHLVNKHTNRQERQKLLEAQKKEITSAKPQIGEEENLLQLLDQLRNAGKISHALQEAYAAVYDSRSDSNPALISLQSAAQSLAEIINYNEFYEKLHERINSLYFEAEDIGLELRESINCLDTDENSLQKAAERIDLLKKLGRKYSVSPDELPDALQNIMDELEQLGSLEDDLSILEINVDKALKEYKTYAKELSQSRKLLASSLSKQMIHELSELNMAGTDFIIQFETIRKEVSSSGQDEVRMLLAPNKGEEAKPLSRIASGGEISRLMLALKSISAQHNIIPTMIFDEIDTGISGRTAQVVAQKLWSIAKFRQVLCVTHLQQIAAMASTQYLVEKNEVDGRTLSDVKLLNYPERISEISRIISGYSKDSDSSLQHAENMLKDAETYRSKTI